MNVVNDQRAPRDLSQILCESLSGVGRKSTELLKRLGIVSLEDLLFHLPLRYENRSQVITINHLTDGQPALIEGVIHSVFLPRGRKTRFLCRLSDDTGYLDLRFFHYESFYRRLLKPGIRLRCYGEIRQGKQYWEMIHPEYHVISNDVSVPCDRYLTPVYSLTAGISQASFRKWIREVLHLLQNGFVTIHDHLPPSLQNDWHWPTLPEALCFLHHPPVDVCMHALSQGQLPAQSRIFFDELLAYRVSLLSVKQHMQTQQAIPLAISASFTQTFLKQLPFTLTSAQKRVIEEITLDLEKSTPMLRLLQGDVGSGKTVVAAVALLQAVANHCQAALLAPTELLAEQHYRVLHAWFLPLNIQVVLLTGQLNALKKKAILSEIADGRANIIIGTHAIFQNHVTYHRLAFVIVDEQHRFGVRQRDLLRQKGMKTQYCPHQLAMTATPIPRSMMMSLYANVDCSVIDVLPANRQPIMTAAMPNTRREEIYQRLQAVIAQGQQVYWVCTLIEESTSLQAQAAVLSADALRGALPRIRIGLMHGRLSIDEKEAIMHAFQRGDIDILVATTVIEVGIDVPNATVIVIENAERLGLAQLHQLRGRVGRGSSVSYCILLYQPPLSDESHARLSILRESQDGFVIAERDLAIRGPGDVLGLRQTGYVPFRVANLSRDFALFYKIQAVAQLFAEGESRLLLLRRWGIERSPVLQNAFFASPVSL